MRLILKIMILGLFLQPFAVKAEQTVICTDDDGQFVLILSETEMHILLSIRGSKSLIKTNMLPMENHLVMEFWLYIQNHRTNFY